MQESQKIKAFLDSLQSTPQALEPTADLSNYYRMQRQMEEVITPEEKRVITYKFLPQTGSIKILPLFDVHVGLKSCWEELLEAAARYILESPDTYTILGGDLMESATRDSVGKGIFDEKYHVKEQRRRLEGILHPLAEKGKILCGISGNHEQRVSRFNDDNPIEELCYDIGVTYEPYQAYLDVMVGAIHYTIFVHHGKGGGRTKGAKINSAVDCMRTALCDVNFTGHSHEREWTEVAVHEIDESSRLVLRKRYYIVCGSLCKYFGTYAEMKRLAPSVPGTVLVELSARVKDVRIY